MLNKIKSIISKTDNFLYKKFGSSKSIKFLENIKEAEIIFSYLNKIGEETKIRFVGGCVRKALSGEIIDDIDLATSLEPDEIKQRLIKNDVRVVDTGISHGTVTAILNKKKFEITTLRKDILTDGRHANVQFTLDWKQDALRRDFTINSIYADIEGRIFDPLNGISDLKNGKIKFIGSPEERIQEDYLRILRYFRFFTQYSKEDHDQDIIKSIKKNINGLNKIANERIFEELKKILKLKNLYNLFSNNYSREVILNIFPQFKYYERLNEINSFNSKLKKKYDSYLILSLIIIDESSDYEYFCHKYKVSNLIKNKFKNISSNFNNLRKNDFYTKENMRKTIYFFGRDNTKDLLFFSACLKNNIRNFDIEKLANYVDSCKIPKFPISGDYLKEHGYKTGKELGEKLKILEEKWLKNNFILDKNLIQKTINKHK